VHGVETAAVSGLRIVVEPPFVAFQVGLWVLIEDTQ
jgi:hypothetical protein